MAAKLLLDEMLRRTATWCRILGIDTEILHGKSDSELLERAGKEDRILVTRDMELSLRCEKRQVKCIFVRSDKPEEQIAQIIRESGAKTTFPEAILCPACNGELEVVDVSAVEAVVPPNVLATQKKFWKCKSCGKAYWEGSHWRNITKFYEKVRALL